MTDGERREPFQPLASTEVRVPIASGSTTSQAPQPGEEKDEDTLSACKSIQDSLASAGSSARDTGHDGENQVPYPALASTVFFCLDQTTRPRSWCLKLVCNPYPFHSEPGSFTFLTILLLSSVNFALRLLWMPDGSVWLDDGWFQKQVLASWIVWFVPSSRYWLGLILCIQMAE